MAYKHRNMSDNFYINMHYLFVHMFVYNKHLLINMHCININITMSLSFLYKILNVI